MAIKISIEGKAEEIFEKVPKKYRKIIIESLLVDSVFNGSLLKHADIFLKKDEIEELAQHLETLFKEEIKIQKKALYYTPRKSKKINDKSFEKEIQKSKKMEEEIDSLFIGFDED